MATKTIKVTPEELERAAGKIEELAGDYKSQYDALYKETDEMASSWKGVDNIAYTNQIAGFKDDFQKMYELMNQYAEFLKKSAEAYRETQGNVEKQAKTLQN